jgi:hypothetical protein
MFHRARSARFGRLAVESAREVREHRALPSSAASFWDGLAHRSLASILGAALFAALELVVACALLTPRNLARLDSRWIAADPSDEYGRMTIDALRMRYASGPERHVVYVGPSTARLALVDAQRPAQLSAALTLASGERVTFHDFTADALTLEDASVVLDYLPDHMRGVVVFTMSDTRNPVLREKERLGLDKPSLAALGAAAFNQGPLAVGPAATRTRVLKDYGEKQDFDTGVEFLDHLSFFAVRRGALARLQPVPVRKPMHTGRHAPPGLWALAQKVAETRTPQVINRQINEVSILARIAKKHGLEFVVMEAPINPRFEAMKPPDLRDYYDDRMRTFVESTGVDYWDLSPEVGLTPEDFFDAVHVGSGPARARWQHALVSHLVEFFKFHPRDDG